MVGCVWLSEEKQSTEGYSDGVGSFPCPTYLKQLDIMPLRFDEHQHKSVPKQDCLHSYQFSCTQA